MLASDSDLITQKERYFRDFQIWPLTSQLNFPEWRKNFLPYERVFVDRLIDRFIFLSDPMISALLQSAIQRYLNFHHVELGLGDTLDTGFAVIKVEGENPSPADSGHSYIRRFRDMFNFPEENLLTPESALLLEAKFHTFIFLDDFVGSGNQMTDTWNRNRKLQNGDNNSFRFLANKGKHQFVYCPCLCTEKGRKRLTAAAPQLHLFPAHFVTERYCASDSSSPIWEGLDGAEAVQFLEAAAKRAGYSATDGSEDDWRGFDKLGLSIAFPDTIPDASLPIYYSQRNGWTPLKRRYTA